jgi:hypothetical protein
MSTVVVWQSSDADVLTELGALETRLHSTWAQMFSAVIRSVLARLPPHLGAEKRAEVEAEVARHARTLDAGQLAVLGKRILAYLDQDGPRPPDTPQTALSTCSVRRVEEIIQCMVEEGWSGPLGWFRRPWSAR